MLNVVVFAAALRLSSIVASHRSASTTIDTVYSSRPSDPSSASSPLKRRPAALPWGGGHGSRRSGERLSKDLRLQAAKSGGNKVRFFASGTASTIDKECRFPVTMAMAMAMAMAQHKERTLQLTDF